MEIIIQIILVAIVYFIDKNNTAKEKLERNATNRAKLDAISEVNKNLT